jgi:hypothetical protein
MAMTMKTTPIARLSRWIRIAAWLFLATLVAIYVVTWAWPELTLQGHARVMSIHIAGISLASLSSLSIGERLLVSAASLPYLAALVWAFFRLDRMLRGFERGAFFERQTVGDLRAFAGLLLAAKVLSLLAMHVRGALVVHLLGLKGHTMVNLSSDDLSILLLCALMFTIAHMMEEGRRLSEENRGFV